MEKTKNPAKLARKTEEKITPARSQAGLRYSVLSTEDEEGDTSNAKPKQDTRTRHRPSGVGGGRLKGPPFTVALVTFGKRIVIVGVVMCGKQSLPPSLVMVGVVVGGVVGILWNRPTDLRPTDL